MKLMAHVFLSNFIPLILCVLINSIYYKSFVLHYFQSGSIWKPMLLGFEHYHGYHQNNSIWSNSEDPHESSFQGFFCSLTALPLKVMFLFWLLGLIKASPIPMGYNVLFITCNIIHFHDISGGNPKYMTWGHDNANWGQFCKRKMNILIFDFWHLSSGAKS